MTKTLLKKAFGLAVLFLILNPRPMVSDAQMREEMRGVPREASVQKTVCVHAEQIGIEQSEVLVDGSAVSMPQMHLFTSDEDYEVTLAGDVQGDYDQIFANWQKLVQGAGTVCLNLVYLQSLDSVRDVPNALWVIQQMKSERGEWAVNVLAVR